MSIKSLVKKTVNVRIQATVVRVPRLQEAIAALPGQLVLHRVAIQDQAHQDHHHLLINLTKDKGMNQINEEREEEIHHHLDQVKRKIRKNLWKNTKVKKKINKIISMMKRQIISQDLKNQEEDPEVVAIAQFLKYHRSLRNLKNIQENIGTIKGMASIKDEIDTMIKSTEIGIMVMIDATEITEIEGVIGTDHDQIQTKEDHLKERMIVIDTVIDDDYKQ